MNPRLSINEAVVVLVNTEASAVGDSMACSIPAGSVGTVVFVHADVSGTVQYEVEFPIGRRGWAQSVLGASDVESLSQGRVYVALISGASTSGEGRRVAVVAKDLESAHKRLEERYGGASILDLHNEADAELPRGSDA